MRGGDFVERTDGVHDEGLTVKAIEAFAHVGVELSDNEGNYTADKEELERGSTNCSGGPAATGSCPPHSRPTRRRH
ncbi:hypothetical protein NKH18_18550 [Streptomyces sp. M10(2022)]